MRERIKALRKALKLNQKEFGRETMTSLSAVQKWESGENTPSPAIVALIARKWNVSEAWLRSGEGEMFEELDPDEELMRFVGTITKDDAHPLNRLARILAHLPPEGIELISQAVEYLLDREQSQK